MSSPPLVDSPVLIEAASDRPLSTKCRSRLAEDYAVNAVILAEFYGFFRRHAGKETALLRTEALLRSPRARMEAITEYACLRAVAIDREACQGLNDALIAAHALETGRPVLTLDRAFPRPEGLEVVVVR